MFANEKCDSFTSRGITFKHVILLSNWTTAALSWKDNDTYTTTNIENNFRSNIVTSMIRYLYNSILLDYQTHKMYGLCSSVEAIPPRASHTIGLRKLQ